MVFAYNILEMMTQLGEIGRVDVKSIFDSGKGGMVYFGCFFRTTGLERQLYIK